MSTRPTHFLAIPLGQHYPLREAWHNLSLSWLNRGDITGLDPTIVSQGRRLHLTLGVMALDQNHTVTGNLKSTEQALSHLQSLAPVIHRLIGSEISLKKLGTFPKRHLKGDLRKCRVLYVEAGCCCVGCKRGGTEGEGHDLVKEAAEIIHDSFKKEGFITERRPLELHVTLLNTSSRKRPDTSQSIRGIPFDGSSIAVSEVDLGEYPVESVQLCLMGSRDELGAYVSNHHLELTTLPLCYENAYDETGSSRREGPVL